MVLVFDLDDTLYDERSYVMSGFAAVAEALAPDLGVSPNTLVDRMEQLLDEHGRGRVFDLLLSESGVQAQLNVQECVDIYRGHTPRISVTPQVRTMLQNLSSRPLYLVTDGDPAVQARKIDALGIAPYFTGIHRTWSYGRQAGKPSLECFQMIADSEKCAISDLVYVGDDPSKDFVALRREGATTVRVHTGRCASAEAPDGYDAAWHVARVTDVPALLGLEGA